MRRFDASASSVVHIPDSDLLPISLTPFSQAFHVSSPHTRLTTDEDMGGHLGKVGRADAEEPRDPPSRVAAKAATDEEHAGGGRDGSLEGDHPYLEGEHEE